ncbi:MAG: DUF4214 domain-containing protein [Methanothrix sp.]
MDPNELIYYAYNILLGRDPDPEGLDFWTKQLQNKSKDAFLSAIVQSEEFSNHHPSWLKLQNEISPHHIYSGYNDSDIEMMHKYILNSARLHDDHFVDGFGQRTLLTSVPFASKFNLNRLTMPVPDDGFHAEALEYIALIDSITRSKGSFCAVEIGAGWGPWISLAGVLARAQKFSNINLVGVEGLPARFELMKRQLAFNGLRPNSQGTDTLLGNIHCKLFEGAAGVKSGHLFFPDVSVMDMGSAASTEDNQTDYRGLDNKNIKVKSYALSEIMEDLKKIDYLHIDIQGSEYDLIAANLTLLNERVAGLMIATHSRVIEGKLIELLYGAGWLLHREKPCRVDWGLKIPSLTGMTVVDGCQYWRK